MERYFDEMEAGEYFIDPNDIEHPLFELMGTTPDWKELFREGHTSWWSEDDKIWVYLSSDSSSEYISIEVGDGDIGFMENIHDEHFSLCCADCFADVCVALLERTQRAFEDYGLI